MTNGGQPLLSEEETHALLQAVREPSSGKSVSGAELGNPERAMRHALDRAYRVSVPLALATRLSVMKAVTASVSATADVPAVEPMRVAKGDVPPGTLVIELGGTKDGTVVVLLPGELTAIAVSRRLGADFGEMRTPPSGKRELTTIDRRFLRELADSLAVAFTECWAPGVDSFRVRALRASHESIDAIAVSDSVLRIGVQLSIAGSSSIGVVFILDATTAMAGTRPSPVDAIDSKGADIALGMRSVHIDVVGVLGKAMTTVRGVLELNVGDVLRLEQAADLPVSVVAEDVALFRGFPVTRRGSLAIEITDVTRADAVTEEPAPARAAPPSLAPNVKPEDSSPRTKDA